MIRVLIVTDWPLFRVGIRVTLEHMGDCAIVGESTEADKVIELAQEQRPDVVLLDGGLLSIDAFELAQQLHKHVPTVSGLFVFAPSEDEEHLFQFVKLGAVAYEKRDIGPEELVEKVRSVSRGEYLITGNVLVRAVPEHRPIRTFSDLDILDEGEEGENGGVSGGSPLSTREIEILEHIARGSSNKEIAKTLNISDQTVKNHITSILKKLGVNDRTAAVVYALRKNWIKLNNTEAPSESVS